MSNCFSDAKTGFYFLLYKNIPSFWSAMSNTNTAALQLSSYDWYHILFYFFSLLISNIHGITLGSNCCNLRTFKILGQREMTNMRGGGRPLGLLKVFLFLPMLKKKCLDISRSNFLCPIRLEFAKQTTLRAPCCARYYHRNDKFPR